MNAKMRRFFRRVALFPLSVIMGNLDDFLEPEAPKAPAANERETAEETGEAAPQAAAEIIPAVTPTADLEGIKAAMIAERRQRQALEAQLAARNAEEKPYLGEEYEQRFAETRNEFRQQLIDLSESYARDKYADFDDKIKVFEQMVQQSPSLYHQMAQQVNPAEFAYKTGMNQQKLQEMGDPASYEQKLREKITVELEAKYTGKLAAETQRRAELPGSLATVAGAGGATAQSWSGPTSLDDLLK